ncbi:alpha/beta hydrolase family esterase [Streptomyces sp. NBC_00370]|uniref:alpha/beta hydrolase family esterase n=1 Tax=Streptomyces sp. NBC_00370 TaxID=2975728 RepID=UPI002E263D8D
MNRTTGSDSRSSGPLRRLASAVIGLTLVAGAVAAAGPAAAATTGARPAPKAACGLPAPQPAGTSAPHTISSGGRERAYRLHLPAGYGTKRDWPVVLAFHGRGNTGAGTEEFSKLSTLPAVVVYPEGVIGTGDGDRQAWQGAPYAAAGVDDVAFTGDLLDRLEATLCVDERRVYATGKSNGAGFVSTLLACRMADRIAAVAPVAAALYPTGEECRPARPMPMIDFHGTGDVTIPYAGDADRGLPAIDTWVAGKAALNGCRSRASVQVIEPDITVSRWSGCDRGADVRHVAVTDGGHTWPGADSYSGGGYTTQTVEAADVLWDFVRDFRTPQPQPRPHRHH